jgi:hypothetical protein
MNRKAGERMSHAIYRVIGPYTLRVRFDDGTEREIDFRPVLAGEIYGALQDEILFNFASLAPRCS